MSGVAANIFDAGIMTAGMFLDVGWSLVFGFVISALLLVFVSKDRMQQALCAGVRAGVDWREVQLRAHELTAEVLREADLIRCSAAAAVSSGVTRVFLPHGIGHLLGLALVALDRTLQGQRFEIMHKARPHAQAPKWRRAQFVRSILRPGLDDAVAGLDVMQQKVAKGMDDLVAQRRWYREGPAIYQHARRRRRDGRNMTVTAANPLEQPLTGLGVGASRQFGIARRRLRAADELSKVVDIGET